MCVGLYSKEPHSWVDHHYFWQVFDSLCAAVLTMTLSKKNTARSAVLTWATSTKNATLAVRQREHFRLFKSPRRQAVSYLLTGLQCHTCTSVLPNPRRFRIKDLPAVALLAPFSWPFCCQFLKIRTPRMHFPKIRRGSKNKQTISYPKMHCMRSPRQIFCQGSIPTPTCKNVKLCCLL